MLEGLRPMYNAGLRPWARLCLRLGVSPNAVTLFGTALFFGAGACLWASHWTTALVLGVVGSFMDGLDGVVAREGGKKSVFGAVLDSTCDRLTEIAVLSGIMLYFLPFGRHFHGTVAACFLAITGSLMVSYVKARAEGAGLECKEGFFQRPERLIVLGISILLGQQFIFWGLLALGIVTWVTTIQRLILVLQNSRKDTISGRLPPAA